IEDHHHRAHFTLDLLELAHVDAALVPLANSFRHVDAVQNGGGEGLHPDALFGEDTLALRLEEAAIVFDDEVFGRIGADAGAVQLAGPFARIFFLPAGFEAVRAKAALGAGKEAAEPYAAGI